MSRSEASRTCVILAEASRRRRVELADALRADGFAVREATSTEDLLHEVARARERPEERLLIVANVELGHGNGFTAVRALRGWGCRAPVVFISSDASDHVLDQALAAGSCLVMTLPFEVDDFRVVVACLSPALDDDDATGPHDDDGLAVVPPVE